MTYRDIPLGGKPQNQHWYLKNKQDNVLFLFEFSPSDIITFERTKSVISILKMYITFFSVRGLFFLQNILTESLGVSATWSSREMVLYHYRNYVNTCITNEAIFYLPCNPIYSTSHKQTIH